MELKNIPLLTADDVECRIQQVREKPGSKGEVQAILLLYKDARCDMKYLDELFGIYGWKRSHAVIDGRLYCTVSIYDEDKKEWVTKEDVGTESNTEKEKGQASDAFKRACFNIGIGRELYTSPSIKVLLRDGEYRQNNGKYTSYASFRVKEIGYGDKRNITDLVITDRFGNERFVFKGGKELPLNNPRSGRTTTSNYTHSSTGETPPEKISKKAAETLSALMRERTNADKQQTLDFFAYLQGKYGFKKFEDVTGDKYVALIDEITAWWPAS